MYCRIYAWMMCISKVSCYLFTIYKAWAVPAPAMFVLHLMLLWWVPCFWAWSHQKWINASPCKPAPVQSPNLMLKLVFQIPSSISEHCYACQHDWMNHDSLSVFSNGPLHWYQNGGLPLTMVVFIQYGTLQHTSKYYMVPIHAPYYVHKTFTSIEVCFWLFRGTTLYLWSIPAWKHTCQISSIIKMHHTKYLEILCKHLDIN